MNFKDLCIAVQQQMKTQHDRKATLLDVKLTLQCMVSAMTEAAAEGKDISLPNFGKLQPVVRKATTIRNPQDGSPIEVPERKAVKFTQSSVLKQALND